MPAGVCLFCLRDSLLCLSATASACAAANASVSCSSTAASFLLVLAMEGDHRAVLSPGAMAPLRELGTGRLLLQLKRGKQLNSCAGWGPPGGAASGEDG